MQLSLRWTTLRAQLTRRPVWTAGAALLVLLAAFVLGRRPSIIWIAAPVALAGALILMRRPLLSLPLIIVAALLVPFNIGTGTEVSLNAAALLVPAVLLIWLLVRMRRHDIRLPKSITTRPLALFLIASLASLVISNMIWDPSVPRSDRFAIVQLAQWALWMFSATAFWLMGDMIRHERDLKRVTFFFLALGGALAMLRVLPVWSLIEPFTTFALYRAPFWIALGALAMGQLLFNPKLSGKWQALLIGTTLGVYAYAFIGEAERTSNWVSVGVIAYMLAWLRFPKFRVALVGVALLAATVFFPQIYEFGGGDAKWEESGASRITLISRVIELSMRNPITGIGPAAYRPYGFTRPLMYGRALWIEPRINSHNNYVDLFSQVGVVGLALYLWFIVTLFVLGVRLRKRYTTGFSAGYVNGMLAAIPAISVAMLLLDWFLPFVYNVGFLGFQASVLLWMFLGGLVALDNLPEQVEA